MHPAIDYMQIHVIQLTTLSLNTKAMIPPINSNTTMTNRTPAYYKQMQSIQHLYPVSNVRLQEKKRSVRVITLPHTAKGGSSLMPSPLYSKSEKGTG